MKKPSTCKIGSCSFYCGSKVCVAKKLEKFEQDGSMLHGLIGQLTQNTKCNKSATFEFHSFGERKFRHKKKYCNLTRKIKR